jgi:hypothetical protein
VCAVALVALAGCGGSGRHGIRAAVGPSLVVQPADVPDMQQFEYGAQRPYEVHGDPRRYGRLGGWIARYHAAAATGVLVLESRVDLFPSAAAARKDYHYELAQLQPRRGSLPVRPVRVRGLGDAAAGATSVQQALRKVRFYTVIWLDRNATAEVLAQGYDGSLHLAQALAVAQAQDRRIRAAKG